MIRSLLILIFILFEFSSLSANDSTFIISGNFIFRNECKNPDIVIKVLIDGTQRGADLVAGTNPPYTFRGKITTDIKKPIHLDIIIRSPNGFVVKTVNEDRYVNYYGGNIEIEVIRAVDAFFNELNSIQGYYNNRMNLKAMRKIESLLSRHLDVSDRNYYNAIILASKIYSSNNDFDRATNTIKSFLESKPKILNQERYEGYRFLSKLYFEKNEFEKQKDILNKLSSEVNLQKIPQHSVNIYLKEKIDNFFIINGYNDYKIFPAMEFSDNVLSPENSNILTEFKTIIDEFNELNDKKLTIDIGNQNREDLIQAISLIQSYQNNF